MGEIYYLRCHVHVTTVRHVCMNIYTYPYLTSDGQSVAELRLSRSKLTKYLRNGSRLYPTYT